MAIETFQNDKIKKNTNIAIGVLAILIFLMLAFLYNYKNYEKLKNTFSELAKEKNLSEFVILNNYMYGLKGNKVILYQKGGKELWSFATKFQFPEMKEYSQGVFVINNPCKTYLSQNPEKLKNGLREIYEKVNTKSAIICFNKYGVRWKDDIIGMIMSAKVCDKGYIALMYKTFSGNDQIDYIKIYNSIGSIKFKKDFKGEFLVDGGTKCSNFDNEYYAVVQNALTNGLSYKFMTYYSNGNQKARNIVSNEAYIGGNYYGKSFICADTSCVRCFNSGKNLWNVNVKGEIVKLCSSKKYFLFKSNSRGTFGYGQNYINAIGFNGKTIFSKRFTEN